MQPGGGGGTTRHGGSIIYYLSRLKLTLFIVAYNCNCHMKFFFIIDTQKSPVKVHIVHHHHIVFMIYNCWLILPLLINDGIRILKCPLFKQCSMGEFKIRTFQKNFCCYRHTQNTTSYITTKLPFFRIISNPQF